MNKTIVYGCALLTFLSAAAAFSCQADGIEYGWSAGGGVAVFSSPFKGAKDVVAPVPYVSYEGKHLSVTPFGASYKLLDKGNVSVSAFVAPRFQLTEPSDSPALAGMQKRDSTVEAGVSLAIATDYGNLRLDAQTDLLSQHKGSQVSLTYGIGFQLGDISLLPKVGVTWQDEKLADYYYGVRPSEATLSRPAYKVRAAVIPSLGLDVSYPLSSHTRLVAITSVDLLPRAITRSPIVADKSVAQAIVGVIYKF